MLVLKRKLNERIFLDTQDGTVEVSISKVEGRSFSISISAPRSINIRRDNMKQNKPKDRPLTQTSLNDYLQSLKAKKGQS